MSRTTTLIATCLIALSSDANAQSDPTMERIADGMRLREVGPALMGGRISDIAVHPTKGSTWYVAAGSGGLWKTQNAGITWTPVFDDQAIPAF